MDKIDKTLNRFRRNPSCDTGLEEINKVLFEELRPFFRKAMESDLEFCVKALRFQEKWWYIVRKLVDFTYRYVDLNNIDWDDFIKNLLEGQ